jgi:hypothetical protein
MGVHMCMKHNILVSSTYFISLRSVGRLKMCIASARRLLLNVEERKLRYAEV